MKNAGLLQAWHKGQPMLDALLSFADVDEREATLKEEPNIFLSVMQGIAEAKILADNKGISFQNAVEIKGEQTARELKLRQRAISRIFGKLQSGRLMAIGFEPPRQMASVAIEIPIEYLRKKIDWKRNEVTYDSLRFVDVRLVAKSILAVTEADVSTSPNAGRKSRSLFYFACFRALEKQGQLDPTKSINTAFPMVRAWLAREYPETFPTSAVGSDKTIYRYFNEFKILPKAD